MRTPLISIITINYNHAGALEETFLSVRDQSYKEIDYVVIDGGSSDESRAVIEKNRDLISYACSEKDRGIYDAQNKGILKAKGEFLLFLNSGDVFSSADFLEEAVKFIKNNPHKNFVYCNTILRNSDGSFYEIVQPAQLTLFFFYKKTLNHQSCFIRRRLFDAFGLYDLRYKICADFDFILKVFLADNNGFVHFNRFAVIYRNDGFSADPSNYPTVVSERSNIVDKYFTAAQKAEGERIERAQNSWSANIKNTLYNNSLTYFFIKKYVKFKNLFQRA
jgi:glycosyltransferase involved in cell wall biosynthesis